MGRTKVRLALAIATLMAIAIPALAAELHEPHRNSSLDCKKGEEIAVWHFVANQTEGSSAGWLVVKFADNSMTSPIEPTKVNRNVQHWWVRGPDGFATAFSYVGTADNLQPMPGKLVLSDYYCEKVPKSSS